MPRYIVKLEDRYFEFSSVVDAAVTEPMTLDEFRTYYIKAYGTTAAADLEQRLERVEKIGTSCRMYDSVEELLSGNRSGRDGSEVSFADFKRWARRTKRTEPVT